MTKYGYILEEFEDDPAIAAAAIELLEQAKPAIVPIWTRWREGYFDLRHGWLEDLRAIGVEPLVYAETTGMRPEDILAGHHDDAIRLMAARARGALIRILHEPNGHLFEWSGWPLDVYLHAWMHLAVLIRTEGGRMLYCVVHRGAAQTSDMFRHWPGAEWVDALGFDEFRRSNDEALPPRKWASAIAAFDLEAPEAPRYVCETGAIAKTDRRAAFIASFADVEGLEGILCFDRRIVVPSPPAPHPIDDDFRWGPKMIAAWDRLPR